MLPSLHDGATTLREKWLPTTIRVGNETIWIALQRLLSESYGIKDLSEYPSEHFHKMGMVDEAYGHSFIADYDSLAIGWGFRVDNPNPQSQHKATVMIEPRGVTFSPIPERLQRIIKTVPNRAPVPVG